MAVTIKELSARCGLSVSTVSKALNDYPDVSEASRFAPWRMKWAIGPTPSRGA